MDTATVPPSFPPSAALKPVGERLLRCAVRPCSARCGIRRAPRAAAEDGADSVREFARRARRTHGIEAARARTSGECGITLRGACDLFCRAGAAARMRSPRAQGGCRAPCPWPGRRSRSTWCRPGCGAIVLITSKETVHCLLHAHRALLRHGLEEAADAQHFQVAPVHVARRAPHPAERGDRLLAVPDEDAAGERRLIRSPRAHGLFQREPEDAEGLFHRRDVPIEAGESAGRSGKVRQGAPGRLGGAGGVAGLEGQVGSEVQASAMGSPAASVKVATAARGSVATCAAPLASESGEPCTLGSTCALADARRNRQRRGGGGRAGWREGQGVPWRRRAAGRRRQEGTRQPAATWERGMRA